MTSAEDEAAHREWRARADRTFSQLVRLEERERRARGSATFVLIVNLFAAGFDVWGMAHGQRGDIAAWFALAVALALVAVWWLFSSVFREADARQRIMDGH